MWSLPSIYNLVRQSLKVVLGNFAELLSRVSEPEPEPEQIGTVFIWGLWHQNQNSIRNTVPGKRI